MKSTSSDEFDVTFKAGAKVAPSVVKAALPEKYTVDLMQIATSGELAVSEKADEKGLWIALKSGQKILLTNRPAKDEKDKPEDLVAKLDAAFKAGTKAARVEGTLIEDKDGNLTLQLTKGEAAAKKDEAPKEEKK